MIRGYFSPVAEGHLPFVDAMGTERVAFTILVPPPYPAPIIPCLLGRDLLARFALFLEEQSERVLPLTHAEADALPLP